MSDQIANMNLHSGARDEQIVSSPSSQHPDDHAPQNQGAPLVPPQEADQGKQLIISFSTGPKRKRLTKACDPCHKSKRRCDGTELCSNCYFASKTCTYTDGSGRPVPAPRKMSLEPSKPADTSQRFVLSSSPQVYHPKASSSQATLDHDDDQIKSTKRYRLDRGQALDSITKIPGLPPSGNTVFDSASGLEPTLTRELVNLFFAHLHPQRMIIHKPSFSAALSHNSVPAYLLHAICALAAPLSKQPRIRTNPARYAGQQFAEEAALLMFGSAGRLICEPNLATAQALCLLQLHEVIANPSWTRRYHDSALQVLQNIGVHKPDIPVITPVPSPEFIHTAIERECVRRVFWLIQLIDMVTSVYLKTSRPARESGFMLRLPADETSFELAVHSTLPEYLHVPAPRTPYASEFGHLIRMFSIYHNVESMIDCQQSESEAKSGMWITESEQAVDLWLSSLPDHLRFSESSLQVQMSMFETSSNTGAWCFCCMHVVHASCMLALCAAKQKKPQAMPQWPVTRLKLIMTSLGGRAKHTVILACVLWPLMKYCHRDDQQVREWSADHEERWGIRVEDCISREWRQPALEAPLQQSQQQPKPPSNLSVPDQGDSTHGQPLHELRLANRAQQTDPQGFASARCISDINIDLVLQGGLAPRNFVANDGPTSLPSLKSSGLLDSWNAPSDSPSAPGKFPWNLTPHLRLETHPALRTNAQNQMDLELTRSVPSGMPVGMSWLAHEPTTSR